MSSQEKSSVIVDGMNQNAGDSLKSNTAERGFVPLKTGKNNPTVIAGMNIPTIHSFPHIVFRRLIGEILVSNLPVGKEITLNTTEWGDLKITTATGNFQKPHNPGTYTLTVKTEEGEAFHDRVTVTRGKTTMVTVLKPQQLHILPGDLLITNLPFGKKITLNTPVWKDFLIPHPVTGRFQDWHASGTFTLIVKADEREIFHDIVTVTIGKTTTVNIPISSIVVGTANLGGRIWFDRTRSGIRNVSDSGIVGVQVDLLNSYGDVIGITRTNDTGKYQFTGLSSGDYRVRFVKHEITFVKPLINIPDKQVFFSPKHKGSNSELDSDADELTGATDIVTLKAGENNLGIDAGMCCSIFDFPIFHNLPLYSPYKGFITFTGIPKDHQIILNMPRWEKEAEIPLGKEEFGRDHDIGNYKLIVKIDGTPALDGDISVKLKKEENNVNFLPCLVVGDEFPFCAEYQGVKFNLTLNFQNYSELTWKGSISSQQSQREPIVVGDDLAFNFPSVKDKYSGKSYGFTMKFNPDPNAPEGFYWKMDIGTFREVD